MIWAIILLVRSLMVRMATSVCICKSVNGCGCWTMSMIIFIFIGDKRQKRTIFVTYSILKSLNVLNQDSWEFLPWHPHPHNIKCISMDTNLVSIEFKAMDSVVHSCFYQNDCYSFHTLLLKWW
jgi:hypothetical protein